MKPTLAILFLTAIASAAPLDNLPLSVDRTSRNTFPAAKGVTILQLASTPSAPSAGKSIMWVDNTGKMHLRNSGGDVSISMMTAQNANTVLAGPSSGSAAVPTYRSLAVSDIPGLTSLYLPRGGNLEGWLGNLDVVTNDFVSVRCAFQAEGLAVLGGLAGDLCVITSPEGDFTGTYLKLHDADFGDILVINGTDAQLGVPLSVDPSITTTLLVANHLQGGGGGPSGAVGAATGTGGSVTVAGTDTAGTIEVTTASSGPFTTNAIVAIVTFSLAYDSAPVCIVVTPANLTTSTMVSTLKMCWVDSSTISTTAFQLKSGSTALSASTTYKWYYFVIR